MTIISKFLAFLLPSVFMVILTMSAVSYHYSTKALNNLADTWLSGRLIEAVRIVNSQEKNLSDYQLETVWGSRIKAQMDAGKLFDSIDMGNQGYVFVVNAKGIIKIHPDKTKIGLSLSNKEWFWEVKSGAPKVVFVSDDKRHLALIRYFSPWDWYIFAADPVEDYYGPVKRVKPYLLIIGCLGFFFITALIVILVHRLMHPLKKLVEGAQQIGKGNFDTSVPVSTRDEFGHLTKEFNSMARNLNRLTVLRSELENEIDQKERVEKQREILIKELKEALNEIKTLRGILPICANCKKIRDDEGYWNILETYVEKHSEVSFSHGICPECIQTLYGQEDWYKEKDWLKQES